MGHLVNQNPIVLEHGRAGSSPDTDTDCRTIESISRAGTNVGSVAGYDQDSDVVNREASKVRRDGLGAVADPIHDPPAVKIRRGVREYHVDQAAAEHDRRRRLIAEGSVNFMRISIAVT